MIISPPHSDPLISSPRSFLESYLRNLIHVVFPDRSTEVEICSEAETLADLSSAVPGFELASGLIVSGRPLHGVSVLAIPGFSVATAWKSGASPWTEKLAQAQDEMFAGVMGTETARLYARLLAMDCLRRDKRNAIRQPAESDDPSRPPGWREPTAGGRAGWDVYLGGRAGWFARGARPEAHLRLQPFDQATAELREDLVQRLISLLFDGLSARQASLRRVQSFDRHQATLIEQVTREAPELIPEDWRGLLLRHVTQITYEPGEETVVLEGRARLRNCRSCSAFLDDGAHGGVSDRYCRYCTDESGALRARSEVEGLLAGWIGEWESDVTPEDARDCAVTYMRAMPAWSGA